ncbi:MAG: YqhA family protein [Cyanobacteria bacterium]|nr:YqhA family protein [Cyanobacteriota bacterium]
MSTSRPGPLKRWERRFERLLWKLRLVAILPVIMSLVSTVVTFTLGTMEIANSILQLLAGSSSKGFIPQLLGGVVSGIDLYLIGIALLIFGYGVYELLISPIDAARVDDRSGHGLLDIRDLDQLKEKLVKVLVVALIVAAFKSMLTLPITDGASLAFFCLSVLLLALSGYLVAGHGGNGRWQQSPMASVDEAGRKSTEA